jgi:hypothetical protein
MYVYERLFSLSITIYFMAFVILFNKDLQKLLS